ncbi:MAG: type II toxin-antitoxin system RelE/ParE family toxin [Pseudomonadales bacterium]|nr:type II toxin-antitoxin system RelE/ParE family toxin [Pseudomonadales bacterium]
MPLKVELSRSALNDLFEIDDYYFQQVNDNIASNIIDELEAAVLSLAEFPEKGHAPRELIDIGMPEIKELISSNYRIIYEVVNKIVYVHAILDSRRDVQTLLQKRLLK